MERCGFNICDLSSHFCDYVTGDCSRCDVFCDGSIAGGELDNYCWNTCPVYMSRKTRKAEININVNVHYPSTQPVTENYETIFDASCALSVLTINIVLLTLIITLLVLIAGVTCYICHLKCVKRGETGPKEEKLKNNDCREGMYEQNSRNPELVIDLDKNRVLDKKTEHVVKMDSYGKEVT